jgi:Flp pilus assembly protein TadD
VRILHLTNRTAAVARASALLLAVTLFAGACAHADHPRHDSADPDVKLARLLDDMDKARACGRNNGAVMSDQEVVVDSGAVKLSIEQLSLEFPNHVPTLVVCAQMCYEGGENDRATAYADRALALQPENNFAAIVRAQAAMKDGNLPLARKVIERQIPLTPESPYLHEVLASVCYYSGDFPGATRELATAERLGSEKWRVAYLRGLVAEKTGNVSEARKQYTAARDMMPTFELATARLTALPPAPPTAPAAPVPPAPAGSR